MRRIGRAVISCAAVTSLFLALGKDACGQIRRPQGVRQYRGVTNEPYVSPYLNLIRPGADPGFNYYTLVQPELQQLNFNQQQRGAIQGLGRQLQQQQAEIMTPYGPAGGIRPTGRGATFMNYSHYYPEMGVGQSGGRRYQSDSGGGGGFGGAGGGFGGMGGGY